MWSVVRVQREQVVDVAAKREPLFDAVDELCHRKDAGVRLALCKAEIEQPGKKLALPPSPGLRHAINGLSDSTHARSAVRSERR
eukprot:5300694-Pleurochrysis_carterae.AAC.1